MLYYLVVFVVLLGVELLYFRVADHFNIIDKPNERSSHTRITLRGGGVVFYVGALVYFVASGFSFPWFMLGLTLIAGVGNGVVALVVRGGGFGCLHGDY